MTNDQGKKSTNKHLFDPSQRHQFGLTLGLRPLDLRLAATINCPHDFRSMALAARTVCQCVRAAADLYPAIEAPLQWLVEIQSSSSRLNAAAQTDQALLTVDKVVAQSHPFGAFARPTKATVHISAHRGRCFRLNVDAISA
jgi:hypothetical protein